MLSMLTPLNAMKLITWSRVSKLANLSSSAYKLSKNFNVNKPYAHMKQNKSSN